MQMPRGKIHRSYLQNGGGRFSLSAFCGVGGAKWGEGRGEVLVKLKLLWLHSARAARSAGAGFLQRKNFHRI